MRVDWGVTVKECRHKSKSRYLNRVIFENMEEPEKAAADGRGRHRSLFLSLAPFQSLSLSRSCYIYIYIYLPLSPHSIARLISLPHGSSLYEA